MKASVSAGRHAQGHDAQTMFLTGKDHAALFPQRLRQAQHQGNARPIDIGVEKPCPETHPGKSHGQIDRDSGFAYSALATGHRDKSANLFYSFKGNLGEEPLALFPTQGGDVDFYLGDIRYRP